MSKLPADALVTPAEKPAEGKARLMTLADLDGRTNAAKAAKALVDAIVGDLGGARLSAGERVLAHRAAIATAMLEDMEAKWLSGHPLDVPAYAALTNVVSRSLRILGLERRAKDVTPDLTSYIDAHASEPDKLPGQRTKGDAPHQPPRTPRPPRPSAPAPKNNGKGRPPKRKPDELAGQEQLPLATIPPCPIGPAR